MNSTFESEDQSSSLHQARYYENSMDSHKSQPAIEEKDELYKSIQIRIDSIFSDLDEYEEDLPIIQKIITKVNNFEELSEEELGLLLSEHREALESILASEEYIFLKKRKENLLEGTIKDDHQSSSFEDLKKSVLEKISSLLMEFKTSQEYDEEELKLLEELFSEILNSNASKDKILPILVSEHKDLVEEFMESSIYVTFLKAKSENQIKEASIIDNVKAEIHKIIKLSAYKEDKQEKIQLIIDDYLKTGEFSKEAVRSLVAEQRAEIKKFLEGNMYLQYKNALIKVDPYQNAQNTLRNELNLIFKDFSDYKDKEREKVKSISQKILAEFTITKEEIRSLNKAHRTAVEKIFSNENYKILLTGKKDKEDQSFKSNKIEAPKSNLSESKHIKQEPQIDIKEKIWIEEEEKDLSNFQDKRENEEKNLSRLRFIRDQPNRVKIPDCVEKWVISLLLLLSNHVFPELKLSFDIKVSIEDSLKKIEYHLQDESLFTIENRNLLSSIENDVTNKKYESAYQNTERLLSKTRPLDIELTRKLVSNVYSAAEKIKDSEIILILGKTGSGKSTLIQFLAGAKMIKTKVSGLTHYCPDPNHPCKNEDLKNVVSSPFFVSETRNIIPVRINPKDFDIHTSGGMIIICDSPGFGDNNGPPIDIANQVGILIALKSCRRVKPVIVMNYKDSGSRMDGLKDLAYILVNMINGIGDHMDSFSYIFTNYPEDEKNIENTIENLLQDLTPEQDNDIGFKQFLTDIKKKVSKDEKKNKRKVPYMIDLLNDDNSEILSKYLQSPFIEKPGDVFTSSISSHSIAKIKEQLTNHIKCIEGALKRENIDFKLINHKLTEMKELSLIVDHPFVKREFEEGVQKVKNFLDQTFKNKSNLFGVNLFKYTTIEPRDIKDFRDSFSLAKDSEEFRNQFANDAAGLEMYSAFLKDSCGKLIADAQQKISELNQSRSYLNKLLNLCETFEFLMPEYKRLCEVIMKNLETSKEEFEKQFKIGKFDLAANELQNIINHEQLLSEHIDQKIFRKLQEESIGSLKSFTKGEISTCKEILNRKSLQKNDIEILEQKLDLFDMLNLSIHLEKLVGPEVTKKPQEEVVKRILEYLSNIQKDIENELAGPNKNKTFEPIKDHVYLMIALRKIPIVEQKSTQIFYCVMNSIKTNVDDMRRSIESITTKIYKRDGANFVELRKALKCMETCKWLEDAHSGLYKNLKDDAENHLSEYLDLLENEISNSHIDIESKTEIENAAFLITELGNVEPLKEIFEAIGKTAISLKEKLIKRIILIFEDIQTAFDPLKNNQLDENYSNVCLEFFSVCKKYAVIRDLNCQKYEKIFENYHEKIGKTLEDNFQLSLLYVQTWPEGESNVKKQELENNLRKQCNLYIEIFGLRNQSKAIFDLITKGMRKIIVWVDDLKECCKITEKNLDSKDSIKEKNVVNEILDFLQILLRLDPYSRENIFETLRQKKIESIAIENQEAVNKIKDALAEFDFDTVARLIPTINDKDCSNIQEQINKLVQNQINSITDLLLNFDLEADQLKTVLEKLKNLEEALRYLPKMVQESRIQEIGETTKNKLESRIQKIFSSLRDSIEQNDFSLTSDIWDKIASIHETITTKGGKYLLKETMELLLTAKEKYSPREKLEKYNYYSIKDFIRQNPKHLHQCLDEASKKNIFFKSCASDLIDNITKHYNDEFDQLESLDIQQQNEKLKVIESTLQYIPEIVKERVESLMKDCKSINEKKQNEMDEKIEKAFKDHSFSKLSLYYAECQKLGMKKKSEMLIENIQEKLNLQKNEVGILWSDHKYMKSLETALEYFENCQKFAKDNISPEPIIFPPFKNIITEIDELIDIFRLDRKKPDQSLIEKLKLKTTKFLFCYEFALTKKRDENSEFFTNNFQTNFVDKLESFFTSINAYFDDFISDCTRIEQVLRQKDAKKDRDLIKLNELISHNIFWEEYIKLLLADIPVSIQGTKVLSELRDKLNKIPNHTILREQLSEAMIEIKVSTIKMTEEFYKIKNQQEWNIFAKKISDLLDILDQKKFASPKKSDSKLYKDCKEKIEKSLKDLHAKFEEEAKSLGSLKKATSDFSNLYFILNAFHLQSNDLGNCSEAIKRVSEILEKEIKEISKSCQAEISIEKFASLLIQMKIIGDSSFFLKEKFDKEIEEVLINYKKNNQNNNNFGKLGQVLETDEQGVGMIIMNEQACFKGYTLYLFNQKVIRREAEYVLNSWKTNDTDFDKKLLLDYYKEYEDCYTKLITEYLKPKMDTKPLIANIRLKIGYIEHSEGPNGIMWNKSIRSKIPTILAHILALHTLNSSVNYFENKPDEKLDQVEEDKRNYLFQPHAAQVLSIFRMLGLGFKNEKLQNNLVQMGTGEGKSITIAATAALLALFGFDVSGACYSEYLCNRDYEDFSKLFEDLNVKQYINYNVFRVLCEKVVNERGQVRDIIRDFILDQKFNIKRSENSTRPKILIIDEVDVFFNKEFCGSLYIPSASIKDQTITDMVNHIWANRSTITLSKLRFEKCYQDCLKRFAHCKYIIEEAAKEMLADLKTFESHEYVVYNGMIGYKEHTNIVTNIRFGYKTLFAYFQENQNDGRAISYEKVQEKISIGVKCGMFSYSELPSKFNFIFGVTGTLEVLSRFERETIEKKYLFTKHTVMPSVFGKNKLKREQPNEYIHIEEIQDFFPKLCDHIKIKSKDRKRAILVFFDSDAALSDFKTYIEQHPIGDYQILDETLTPSEKRFKVKLASSAGKISLMTPSFGRGTDFICRDKIVSENGGIHVIQAFLSAEISEEIQIKGRTARQGDEGSYSMFLLIDSLEKYNITKAEIEEYFRNGRLSQIPELSVDPSIYDLLDFKRKKYFESIYNQNLIFMKNAIEEHNEADKFLNNLLSDVKIRDLNKIHKFLHEHNKGPEEEKRARTLVLMDATGSMSSLLESAKLTVSDFFKRIQKVLSSKGISKSCFEMNYAVYRNYGCGEESILQYSGWHSNADDLRQFMEKIKPEGGEGDEAVEIGLNYANLEASKDEVHQVILIGDAPANSEENVVKKRANYRRSLLNYIGLGKTGESYWKDTKYDSPTHYKKELSVLKEKKIPVHSFYLRDYAKVNFKEISEETGGNCDALDIWSSSGSEKLTDLISVHVLNIVGKVKGNDELYNAYRSKYPKSYT